MIEGQWTRSEAWSAGVAAALTQDNPKNPFERKTKDWQAFIDGLNYVKQFEAFQLVAKELAGFNPTTPVSG